MTVEIGKMAAEIGGMAGGKTPENIAIPARTGRITKQTAGISRDKAG